MFDIATPPLVFPAEGIRLGDLLFRVPTEEDVPVIAPAFQDPDVGGRANMPTLDEMTLLSLVPKLAERMEQGVFLARRRRRGDGRDPRQLQSAPDRPASGPGRDRLLVTRDARGRGIATRTARFLAEHAFSLGFERIEARVFADNPESERVLERAGFTREGVLRSLPRRAGGRDNMTLYSLLPGE